MRKDRSDGLITKQKIIAVARPEFEKRGYEAVTSKDICVLAGVNIAAINYHFGTLDGLKAEVEKLGHIPSYKELKETHQRLLKEIFLNAREKQ